MLNQATPQKDRNAIASLPIPHISFPERSTTPGALLPHLLCRVPSFPIFCALLRPNGRRRPSCNHPEPKAAPKTPTHKHPNLLRAARRRRAPISTPLPPLFSASSAPSATSAYQSPLFEPFAIFAFNPIPLFSAPLRPQRSKTQTSHPRASHDLCAQNGRGARHLADFPQLFLSQNPQHLTAKQAPAYRPGLCAQIGPRPGITETTMFTNRRPTHAHDTTLRAPPDVHQRPPPA